jgi:predicted dehydrogenase
VDDPVVVPMRRKAMATSSRIRVGIVGLSPNRGFASIAHIPALRALPEFEIAAVCTTRQESAEATARHFGIPLAFSDPEKLARHKEVDLVTVTVKVPDHYRPVIAAIEAGKHVYCEWPLGRNTEEARRMLDAADRAGVSGFRVNIRRPSITSRIWSPTAMSGGSWRRR